LAFLASDHKSIIIIINVIYYYGDAVKYVKDVIFFQIIQTIQKKQSNITPNNIKKISHTTLRMTSLEGIMNTPKNEIRNLSPENQLIRRKETAKRIQAKYRETHRDDLNALRRNKYNANVASAKAFISSHPSILPVPPQTLPILSPAVVQQPPPVVLQPPVAVLPTPTPSPEPTPPQPRKIVILNLDEILANLPNLETNHNTLRNSKSSVRKLIEIFGGTVNIVPVLMTPNFVFKKLREKYGNVNTLKAFIQTILKIINKWYSLKLPDVFVDEYKREFQVLKAGSFVQTETRNAEEDIPTYSEYLEKIKKLPQYAYKMNVIAQLFNEVPVRDDFQLKIMKNFPQAKETKDTNNIYMPDRGNAVVFIHNSKTSNKFKMNNGIGLSPKLTKTIKDYMITNTLNEGEFLFGNHLLSQYIIDTNLKIKVAGGLDLMRRMKIKEINALPLEEKVRWSNLMMHDFKTQQTHYVSTAPEKSKKKKDKR
jgi:hypothetical protein